MSRIVVMLISLIILVVVLVPRCTATNFTNYGTNFYFGLMKNAGYTNGLLALVLSTASGINVSVTINIPGSPLNELISSPNHAPITSLSGKSVVSESSTYDNRNRGIHVSSDQPIAVSAFNWLSGSLGEYLVLPCHDYNINNYEYYAVSARSTSNVTSSQVLLVGCENDTNIIITPSEAVFLPSDTQSSTDQLISVPKGTPHHVVLHQGQTLYFGAPLIDLTGTHIVSNKPLTVISGHQCGQVPLGVNYCEHMTQQIPPTITWGKQFLLVPFEHRQSGQYTKLVTSQDHTTITISCNGSTTNVVFINSKGGKYTLFFGSSQYCHIQANKPIIVVLFATGSSLDNNFGDPIMILVPPIEQYSCRFDFPVFINIYFVGISITTSPEDFSPNSILLDGVPLTNWVTILNSSMDIVGYGTKIATTANTVHTVLHTGNGTLSVLLYGFKRHRGYGLLVGMTLMPINKGAIIKCYSSCVHGICEIVNNTYTCDCFQGWTGSNCDQVPRCIGTNFTNYGTDFYFGLMKNYNSQRDFLGLAISTVNHNVSVTIKIPWSGSTVNKLISSLNDINIVNLTNITNVSESSNYDNRNRSIHVSSNQPISVIALNWLSGSSGEYLVLPCHDYNINRYEYYAVTPRSTGWSSQVLLVGCENDTNIIITPSEAVSLPSDTQSSTDQFVNIPNGTSHHIVLHQGQTLYFGAPLIDLTGTHIVSNKPLTVISGHQCGQVPLGVGYCEHMTQQIPPTITWGKQFLLVPFEHRQSGQYTKLVTSQDHTTITISCNGSKTNAVIINNKGGNYTFFFSSSQYCHIQANKPIIVVLFATGGSLDNNIGDPIMILVPPIEQYSCRFDFPVFINIDFVGISITTSPEDFSPKSILLDGVPLTNWVTILNSSMDIVGYGTKIATTSNTVHTVLHTGNGTLSVLLYGFKWGHGYGLLVGMMLMPINKGECYSSCVHGICEIINNTYTCDCFYGWTGSNCDQDKLSAISVVISVVTVLVFVLLVVFIAIVVMTVRNKFLKRQLEINQQNELELNIYGELNNINYNKSPKSVGEQDDQFKKKLAEIPPEPMYDNIDELSIEEESEDFHQQSCYLLFKK